MGGWSGPSITIHELQSRGLATTLTVGAKGILAVRTRAWIYLVGLLTAAWGSHCSNTQEPAGPSTGGAGGGGGSSGNGGAAGNEDAATAGHAGTSGTAGGAGAGGAAGADGGTAPDGRGGSGGINDAGGLGGRGGAPTSDAAGGTSARDASGTSDIGGGSDTSGTTDTGGITDTGGTSDASTVVAFPGAEGFGRNALGGRGGEVCHVTTLNDAGAGSLRDCISQSNRTVVFDVGGWITLASNLGILQSNITIAGQTAPGGGIGVRGHKVSVGGKHIVMRFLRVRRGILVTTARDDAMTVSSSAENVILDHCSVSFGTDETLSMPGDEGIGPHDFTLQWSIVSFGLQRNNHSAGALFTSNQTTIHHSLWAFNKTRNPRARSEDPATRGQGGPLDWVNNVIYGWNAPDPVGESLGWSLSYDPFILGGTVNGQHAANAVGNYFISARTASYAFHNGTPNFSLYAADNLLDGNANGMLDVSKSGMDMVEGTPTLLTQRLPAPMVTTDSPLAAYEKVLAGVGATAPARDQVDALLVSRIKAQTGILIQSEQDLVAEGVDDQGYGTLPAASRPAGFDIDQDGMPDVWEAANGLDAGNPADRNGDADHDGYTNLEEYLNSLVP
jgi:hypothetical protein